MEREALIACFWDTVETSNQLLKKQTAMSISSNRVYKEGFIAKKQKKTHKADIIVESNTSFKAAKEYLQYGKVAVLNFANPHNPGGGVQNGAMAQEECLCRSSNLYHCISNENVLDDYYLYNKNIGNYFFSDRLIYTKGVTVFKDDSDVPQIMPKNEWFQVDVITCAAPYIAKRKHTNKTALKDLFKGRIKNIFEAAIDNGVEVLILGAFGCGAFKNPPEVVAKAFHEVIDENGYGEQFKKIVFAIKSTVNDDPYMPCPNIMAFEQEFFIISAEANKLRFSDPYPFEQAFGEIKMPSGRILKGGEQFNPYLEWKSKNNYFGKQFSILGDSISTLAGYNPTGYNVFYDGENCEKSGVKEMKDTWWGKVIDTFGGELLVNNSWSGSRVTRLPDRDKLFPSGCSDERTSSLHINSLKPDVIIIYLGTNDWARGVETYYVDYLGEEITPRYQEFRYSYDEMLKKLRLNYPESEIWCCTLNTTFMSSNPSFKFPHTYGGTHIEEYNEIIKDTARQYKCKVIDLYDYHLPYDSIDGSHPNTDGMNTLATIMLREIGGQEIEQFMDCENNSHEYIVAEQYTGGTKYVCKKCGKTNHISMLYDDELRRIDNNKSITKENDTAAIYDSDAEYVMLPSGITRVLYTDMIKLFDTDKNQELEIQKAKFDVGRSPDCEITIDNSSISRIHASFYYENSTWYIMDKGSTNGTWLNDKKLEQNKKYELYSDDVISFNNVKKYIFYKSKSVTEQAVKEKSISEGTVIDGKYELLKLIGEGGMVKVYLAADKILNKMWAVKVAKTDTYKNSDFIRAAVLKEADMIKSLNHPAIPTIVDLIVDSQYVAVVQEYVEGETLETIVNKYGAQPVENVVDWAKQLCDSLGYLHSLNPPHIYRDMKPANVMLQPNGKIKIVDFGALIIDDATQDYDTCVLGTKGYASPEGYHGRTDLRSDIYSLGVTIHRLLTAYDPTKPPYEIPPIRAINPNLPKGLEYIINKCVQIVPDKRYQNMQEVYSAFDNLSNHVYTSPDMTGSKLKQGIKSLFKKKENKTDSQPPKMNIVQCNNGHFYDASKYSQCPHCEQYPLNKQQEVGHIPCVYASPDIMRRKTCFDVKEDSTVTISSENEWQK